MSACARPVRHVLYLCWPNGRSLHNVGRAAAAALAPLDIHVEVVDSRAWFDRPTPADAVCLAHTEFYWPDFPYHAHVGEVLAVMHDPDEVATVTSTFAWRDAPLRPLPQLAAFDRVLACSRELVDVLGTHYGVRAWHAATYPHNAAAIAATVAAASTRGDGARPAGAPVRFVSTALDLARKNPAWLDHLDAVLTEASNAGQGAAIVDFRHAGRHPPLDESAYLARLAAGDVYVCTSFMEGGPLPVMEAVLAGLAVITTPVGQTADWVHDGENGVVCESVEAMVHAARRYVDDPALLARHQARSRAIGAARRFDVDGWAAFLRG